MQNKLEVCDKSTFVKVKSLYCHYIMIIKQNWWTGGFRLRWIKKTAGASLAKLLFLQMQRIINENNYLAIIEMRHNKIKIVYTG